jgi:NAD+ synthase (glutamine-hydrolysing)
MGGRVKVALLQLNYIVGDLSGNAERIRSAVEAVAAAGAELAITSELALLGYPPRDLLLYPALVERASQGFAALGQSATGQHSGGRGIRAAQSSA